MNVPLSYDRGMYTLRIYQHRGTAKTFNSTLYTLLCVCTWYDGNIRRPALARAFETEICHRVVMRQIQLTIL